MIIVPRRAVIDSNILIDFLAGRPEARVLIATLDDRYVSVVARAEVHAGIYSPASRKGAAALFSQCRMIDVGIEIADIAARIRQATNLALPDAIIAATAGHLGLPLLTRDSAIMPDDIEVIVPYCLQ